MKPIRYSFMFITYLWLRFDLVLFLAFRKNWQPRYQFMVSIFGLKDTDKFLGHRIKLAKIRAKLPPPVIDPSTIEKKANLFLKENLSTKSGKKKRMAILKKLVFFATDQEINEYNIDSYKVRTLIIDLLLNTIFQNTLSSEAEYILDSLEIIVFSRVTYLGAKGEPSPIVHDTIISSVGRLLTLHLNEVLRLREEKLEKLTKIKLIKEIKEADKNTGSLAFSGTFKEDKELKQKFPLPAKHAKLLIKILNHYRFSAWPESRERAIDLIKSMEKQLGFKLDEL